jgi:hypothetical protein
MAQLDLAPTPDDLRTMGLLAADHSDRLAAQGRAKVVSLNVGSPRYISFLAWSYARTATS